MNLALELLFVGLVILDMILTYRIIASGKGVEIGAIAKYYIDQPAVAIIITAVATALLIGWLRLVGKWWIVVPTYLAVYLRLGWLCYKHIRILRG